MSAPRPRRKAPRRYHHGDLKTAQVDAALDLLRRKGPEGLTLRAVAAATGVTATATYRHFADRRQLVAAMAERGFRALQQEMLAGIGAAPGREGLKRVALAYIRFAHANAPLYRVMFGPEVARTDDLPALRETARGVLGFVAEGIRRLQGSGLVRRGDPMLLAVTTWASLHGLAMLSIDGQAEGVSPSADAVAEEMTQVLMFGLAPRDP